MSLTQLFKLGGIFMYPLLVFFIIMLYAIIERMIFFIRYNWQINDASIMAEKCETKNIFCKQIHDVYAKLKALPQEFDIVCTNECEKIQDSLKCNLILLTSIAAIAPIVGFLGTVTGMIAAFRDITNAVNVSTQLVAGGIYEALITTAAGLIISVIASIFYFIYSAIVSRYVKQMQNVVNQIVKNQYIDLCNSKK